MYNVSPDKLVFRKAYEYHGCFFSTERWASKWYLKNFVVCLHSYFECADPESFVRGGPTQTTLFFFYFLVDEGRTDDLYSIVF